MVQGDTLGMMLDVAEQDQGCSILGPKILSPDGIAQSCSARRLPNLRIAALRLLGFERFSPRLFQRFNAYCLDQDQVVEAISGACTLAAGNVFGQVGLLDESLPMGGEDIDWYMRAKEHGINIRYLHVPQVIHIGGASRALALERTDLEGFKALYFYFKKHCHIFISLSYLVLLFFTTILKFVFWLIYWPFSASLKHHVLIKLKVCIRIMQWILFNPTK